MCLSLNYCCCCFTLDVGTKIISVLSTLSALVSTFLYGWLAVLGSELPLSRLLFYSSMAVTALLQTIFGFFFIYGAFTHKPKYTIPWMILTWGQAATLLVLAGTGTALLGYNQHQETTAEISAVIAVYFVYALVLLYLASVVNSRRQQMMDEDKTEASKKLMRHRVLPRYYV